MGGAHKVQLCSCASCTAVLDTRFLQLWTQHVSHTGGDSKAGDLTPSCMVGPTAENGLKTLTACQQDYMKHLFADVVSFAGK